MLTAALLLVVGVALMDRPGGRRLGASGLVAFAVGLAGSAGAAAAPPPSFLAVNAGLLLLGMVLCLGQAAAAIRGGRVLRAGALVTAAGALLAARAVVTALVEAGAVRGILAAATVAAVGSAAGWLAQRTGAGDAIRRRDRRATPVAPAPAALAALALGALAAAFGGHIAVVLSGAVVSAWAAWLSLPPSGRPRPVAPVLVLLLLGGTLWLLGTIAGPEGLALSAISSLPLSAAAERLLAPLLLGAAWALSGLWPLRQPVDGVLTAPIGALLVLRLGLPALPGGLEHWRAAVFPLLLVGIWHAAVTRRLTRLSVGGAFFGLASLEPGGLAGVGWLLTAGVAFQLGQQWIGRTSVPAATAGRILIAVAAAWGGLGVLHAGLRTEVVYTALAAAAVALGVSGQPRNRAGWAGEVPALTPPPPRSIFGRETR
jgi:hypothetical protein